MNVLSRIGLGLGAAMVAGVVDGGVARALMRGVALATDELPAFSVEATLGIMLVFAVTAVPLAVTAQMTTRRAARLTAGIVGTLLLGYSAATIGVQEVTDAAGLDVLHGTALAACLAGLAAVVLLQPWVVLRLVRRRQVGAALA